MAAWTYSDWITQTDASTRLSRLRLHVQEVSDAMANPQGVNSSSHGVQKFDLQGYLKELRAEESSLAAASATAGGVGRIRFRKP